MRWKVILKALVLLEIHGNGTKTLVNIMFAATIRYQCLWGIIHPQRNKGRCVKNTCNAYTSFSFSKGLPPQITFAQFITCLQRGGQMSDGWLSANGLVGNRKMHTL